MRSLLLILILLLPSISFAGGYYQHIQDGYDAETGIYYYPIKHRQDSTGIFSSKSDTRIKNIFIFDSKSNKEHYLFEHDSVYSIEVLTFESHHSQTGNVEFYGYANGIKNNINVKNRELRNNLLIITSQKDSKSNTMWVAKKNGSNLTKLHTFNQSIPWHIDVKNSKIRFIDMKKNPVVTNFDW